LQRDCSGTQKFLNDTYMVRNRGEKRAGRKGRRATHVALVVVMSRECSFYATALVRLQWQRKS